VEVVRAVEVYVQEPAVAPTSRVRSTSDDAVVAAARRHRDIITAAAICAGDEAGNGIGMCADESVDVEWT
jgi:hypothetical protein